MTRMFFSSQNCKAATLENGRRYNADRSGFIHVEDGADVRTLTAGGYVQAGGMPRLRKYWMCPCGWEASISHCPKCDRSDLTRVEK